MPRLLSSKVSYLVIALFLYSSCRDVVAAQNGSDCAELPARPPGIERYMAQILTNEVMGQGKIGYEGDEPDALPLPKASLRSLAEDLEATLRRQQREGVQIEGDAIYFTLYSDNAPSREPDVIPMPKADLWCLLQRGDVVLLYDGHTAHTTRISSVDRETQKVFVIDPWPDRFFMLKDRNILGYTAGLSGRFVRIDRDQFMKVVTGSITLDTPDLIRTYIRSRPAAGDRPDVQRAFGAALLHWGDDRFVEQSIEPLTIALQQYRKAGEKQQELYAANRLHLALLLNYYAKVSSRNRPAAETAMDRLKELWTRYGKETIVQANRAIDNYRIGHRAGVASDLEMAIEFFTRALALQRDYSDAYLYRALARQRKADLSGAIDDASIALTLNDKERLTFAETQRTRLLRDLYGRLRDAGQLQILDTREEQALIIRGDSYFQSGLNRDALEDGQRLIRLRPGMAKGFELAALAMREMGDNAGARQNFLKAIELEPDAAIRAILQDLVAQLSLSGTPH